MLLKTSSHLNFLEIYYYYFFLFSFFNFFILKNKSFFKNFNLIKNFITLKNFSVSTNKISKYLNYNISYKFNHFDPQIFDETRVIKKFYFSTKNKSLSYKFFNLFFLFNFSLFNSNFKPHANYQLFYVSRSSKKLIVLDSIKFLTRWKESYDLLYNVFFYNFQPLIFSTNFFKNETLALNWNYNMFDINLWRYYFPFFTFKLNNYNHKSNFFFDKLNVFNVNFFLITDSSYHFKNLFYMKKKNYYTIGLVNVNLDPWLVSYPIISFFDSYLTQLFFFKLLILINRSVSFYKYNIFKKSWNSFLLKKITF